MAAQTPRTADPLFVDSDHRYGGYRYVIQNLHVVTDFLREHLA
jgi:hypothetical protein